MAYELVFKSTIKSEIDASMIVRANVNDEIFIEIYDNLKEYPTRFICLDKETAIKFAKELRKQISFIKDQS